ncbi:hypothetical protein [uncultured Sulfitobacter sp.]|uniref:hypothetical protein n=1 Tax=uncultured Sulfitobacter sp. TaxID=191468 RepID=UPI002634A0F7|nr:hypothetical protein [uncultured Sulfitobacter sp.]
MTQMQMEETHKPRSNQRRQTESACLRCTTEEKLSWRRTANRLGFDSLSAWIKDLINSDGEPSLHLRRVISGRLGRIGARIAMLGKKDLPAVVEDELIAIVSDLTLIQAALIEGDINACKSDP